MDYKKLYKKQYGRERETLTEQHIEPEERILDIGCENKICYEK